MEIPQADAGTKIVPAFDTIAESASRMAGFEAKGRVLRQAQPEYLAVSIENLGDSLLAIFVDGGKKTYFTIEWVLFGDTAAEGDRIFEILERFADGANGGLG